MEGQWRSLTSGIQTLRTSCFLKHYDNTIEIQWVKKEATRKTQESLQYYRGFFFVCYIYIFLIVADFYLLSLGEKIQIIKSNVHKTDLNSNEIIIFLAVCLDIKFAILSSNASEYSFTFIDC